MTPSVIVWFSQDLRIHDHPALLAAVRSGGAVLPVYVLDEAVEQPWSIGGAGRWWLHQALADLDQALRSRGSRLIIRRGKGEAVLDELLRETGARTVLWSRRYEPALIARDTARKARLRAAGLHAESFNSSLLFEPHTVHTKEGRPYQVFTPFWRTCQTLAAPPRPLAAPDAVRPPTTWPTSLTLDALKLLPTITWDADFTTAWQPTRAGGLARLDAFLAGAVHDYSQQRDIPGDDGTSRLSPYLHWGQLSPREVFHAIHQAEAHERPGGVRFLAELGWREFAYHLLHHFPHTPTAPLRAEFAAFPWKPDAGFLRAWQRGVTGYPLIDAAMRQLWRTGWMHNRLRMVVASFLVKHGLQPWQEGARWFWDTLVDADLAANTLGWQWSAGCGADAAPYFRVFNPILQGEKFDPAGVFVRRFVPELATMPDRYIHRPWEAPAAVQAKAGVRLGATYPRPIVMPEVGRERALTAYKDLRSPT